MQEVDTLVQYVISPIWTYFANLKSEKWNLATIFLFLLILFQDVSWHASKIYFDMIWITKKKSNLIIKDNAPPFILYLGFVLTNLYIFFLKYCPLCYTPILCSSFLLLWWQWKSRSTMQRQSSIFGHINQREIQNRTNAYFALTRYCTMESKCFWSRICHVIINRIVASTNTSRLVTCLG